MPALPTIDYHQSVGPGPSNKKKKGIKIRKKKVELSLLENIIS